MFLDNKAALPIRSRIRTGRSRPRAQSGPDHVLRGLDEALVVAPVLLDPPGLAAVVSELVAGGPGNDELDVRDGTGNDFASCHDGIDWVWTDPATS
jgi:hypothetical protein